ncbi:MULTISPECIES: hypothetical protein [unclassified Staphylococcus]|uniref:hypothetical protein n=1 Tax=unclassified Staphylococcus TaxID=91994 RepID=UPI0021D1A5D6|nr:MULTISPECIES: hypothetical protein [unclassified Staphylococcus]UXR77801.1 hypothetical protein MUA92_08100 [Staphylococcus sp. IVB6227]UXR81960.1 hypothetical protein MUA51_07815 [Staphylococcus sp. IVB6214]
MTRYLINTAMYRFICGGLILLINWELSDPESAIELAIATVISFVPAIFTPIFINTIFKNSSGSLLTKYSILMIFVIVFIMSFIYNETFLLILCNFILWSIFFVIETSFEFWFSELVEGKSEIFINRYSSLSMTVNQIALMIGPLFVTLLTRFLSLHIIFILYSMMYLLIFFMTKVGKNTKMNKMEYTEKSGSVKIIHYVISMLMWPILGTVNFMLPIYTSYQHRKIYEVALLDSMLGIGMAMIGILLSKFLTNKWSIIFLLTSIVIPIVWYIFEGILIVRLLLMLLFGITFGGTRIMFRKMVVVEYASHIVKKIYSVGNAISLPVLMLSIYLGVINLNYVWLVPFILLVVLLLLMNMNYKKGVI